MNSNDVVKLLTRFGTEIGLSVSGIADAAEKALKHIDECNTSGFDEIIQSCYMYNTGDLYHGAAVFREILNMSTCDEDISLGVLVMFGSKLRIPLTVMADRISAINTDVNMQDRMFTMASLITSCETRDRVALFYGAAVYASVMCLINEVL